MVYTMMSYDVPTAVNHLNPSRFMRRIGARVQLSIWVLPKDRIPHNLIHVMLTGGCTVDLLDFAAYEGDRALGIAKAALLAEIDRITASLTTTCATVAHAADVNATGPAREFFRKRTLAALSRAKRLLSDCESALETFGIADVRPSILGAYASVQARRTEMEFRVERYAQMTAALGQLPGATATGLAQEARADILPAGIGADYVQEEAVNETMRRIGAETAAAFQGQL